MGPGVGRADARAPAGPSADHERQLLRALPSAARSALVGRHRPFPTGQRVLVGERHGERRPGDPLQRRAGVGQGLGGRPRNVRQAGRQVQVVQGPLQDVRGEVVAGGEPLALGARPEAGVGEYGGAARRGAHVVEVELEQTRLLARGGETDDQRVQRVVAGRRFVRHARVGHRVGGRLGVGRRHQVISTSCASTARWRTRSRTSRPAHPEGRAKYSSGNPATAARSTVQERGKRFTPGHGTGHPGRLVGSARSLPLSALVPPRGGPNTPFRAPHRAELTRGISARDGVREPRDAGEMRFRQYGRARWFTNYEKRRASNCRLSLKFHKDSAS